MRPKFPRLDVQQERIITYVYISCSSKMRACIFEYQMVQAEIMEDEEEFLTLD